MVVVVVLFLNQQIHLEQLSQQNLRQ